MTMARRLLFALLLLPLLPFALDAQITYDRLLRAAQEPQNWLLHHHSVPRRDWRPRGKEQSIDRRRG